MYLIIYVSFLVNLVRDALRFRDDDGAPRGEEELPHALVLARLLPSHPRHLKEKGARNCGPQK